MPVCQLGHLECQAVRSCRAPGAARRSCELVRGQRRSQTAPLLRLSQSVSSRCFSFWCIKALKRRETRVDGMASIGFRYAAYAHVSVADRLEHLKPVALRNLIECREIVIQLPDEFFRLHGLCQLREPFEVGKQNRCCIIEAGCDPIAALKF